MAWPKGVPNPRKGTKQRLLVDKHTSRMTVPSPSGKQWPVLFGSAATKLLMYVALHPGCKWREIGAALEIQNNPTFGLRMGHLKKIGLVAMLRNRCQINPAIKMQVKRELIHFLRELGKAYGLTPGDQIKTITGPEIPPRERIDLRMNLFGTEPRTRILALIAMLGESYRYEVQDVLGFGMRVTPTRLHHLLQEGVLRSRRFKTAILYSLNPDYPGAKHLEQLLRYIAGHSQEMRAYINYALVRRHQMVVRGQKVQSSIVKEMVPPAFTRTPNGIRMDIGVHSARMLKAGKGHIPIWGKKAPAKARRSKHTSTAA